MTSYEKMKKKMRIRFIALMTVIVLAIAGSAAYVLIEGSTYTERLIWLTNDFVTEDMLSVTVENEDVVKVERVYLDENHKICADFRAVGEGSTVANFSIDNISTSRSPLTVTGSGIIFQTGSMNFDGFLLVEYVVLGCLGLVFLVTLLSFLQCWKNSWFSYAMVACGGLALFSAALFTVLVYGMQWMNSFNDFVTNFWNTGSMFATVTAPVMLVICVAVSYSNIWLIVREGFRVQNMLGIILGVVWGTGEAFVLRNIGFFHYYYGYISLLDTVRQCVAYLISLMSCLLFSTIACAYLSTRHKPPYDRDYIVILGCCIRKDGSLTPILKGRVDAAIRFEREQSAATGKQAVFVTSGGQGADEVISESEAMKRYLIDQGYPEERIIKEDKSVNTDRNIAFSTEKIKENAGTLDGVKAGVATTNYHIFRSYVLSHKHGLEAEGISAKTKWYFYPNAFLREFVGLLNNQKIKLAIICAALAAVCFLGSFLLNSVNNLSGAV